jgi:exosortase E/protease (VPEID-CTERM system)
VIAAGVNARADWRPFRRFASLIALLGIELLAISAWLDTGVLRGTHGVTAMVAESGATLLRLFVASTLVLLVFGESRRATPWKALFADLASYPIASRPLLVAHVAATLLFAQLSSILFRVRTAESIDNIVALSWIASGVVAVVFAILAFAPARFWLRLLASLRPVLVFALIVSIGGYAFGWVTSTFWRPLSSATMLVVYWLLHPLIDGISADPSTLIVGGPDFQVMISRECSGYEGLGLILVFTTAWLWFHRTDWRFPQALVLIPVGLATIWIFNCLRIAALLLIGTAGAPAIALGGFHSQAGWLGFNIVALGICVLARRVRWLTTVAEDSPQQSIVEANPTAVYLFPFLAILASSMISQLASSGFEWLYPIRVAAVVVALWFFSRSYQQLNWRFGWTSIASGGVAFAVWIVLESLVMPGLEITMPAALNQAPETAKIGWLLFRVLGAVITVPIAEELAFRGFLLRRLVSADFESVGWQSVSWIAILLSSIAFGVLHGDRWLAGTIAGAIYAVTWMRRGSMGDAVAAHATTNALIAAWVLIGGHWHLW